MNFGISLVFCTSICSSFRKSTARTGDIEKLMQTNPDAKARFTWRLSELSTDETFKNAKYRIARVPNRIQLYSKYSTDFFIQTVLIATSFLFSL